MLQAKFRILAAAMANDKIYIVGAGGFGKEVRSMLPHLGLVFGGFYDDAPETEGVSYPSAISAQSKVAVAIGEGDSRYEVVKNLPAAQYYARLIHPGAYLQDQKSISIGAGCIITSGSTFTCNIGLGRFCVVNLHCTVGHDVVLEDFCSLMPSVNLSGGVYCEEGVYIGTGATVLPNIRIGAWSKVGAGAVVTEDVPPHSTVVGVPARRIR